MSLHEGKVKSLLLHQGTDGEREHLGTDGRKQPDVGESPRHQVAVVLELEGHGDIGRPLSSGTSHGHQVSVQCLDTPYILPVITHGKVGIHDVLHGGKILLGHLGAQLQVAVLGEGGYELSHLNILSLLHQDGFHKSGNGRSHHGGRLVDILVGTARLQDKSLLIVRLGTLVLFTGDDALLYQSLRTLAGCLGTLHLHMVLFRGIGTGQS